MHALTERELRHRYELDDVPRWKVWGFLALVCGIALLISGLDVLRYVFRGEWRSDSDASGRVAASVEPATEPNSDIDWDV